MAQTSYIAVISLLLSILLFCLHVQAQAFTKGVKYIPTDSLKVPEYATLANTERQVKYDGSSDNNNNAQHFNRPLMNNNVNIYKDALLEKLATIPNVNVFRQALNYTKMDKFLKDYNYNVTVFAPTDRAFEFLPAGAFQYLAAQPYEFGVVLKSHAVQNEYFTDSFHDGMILSGLDGTQHQLFFVNDSENESEGGHWIIDGIKIIEPNITTANGVIHKIDGIFSSHALYLPGNNELRDALRICKQERQLTDFQLALCVRKVADGLASQSLATRPDLQSFWNSQSKGT